jgi:hypothetical protein
MSMEEEEDNKYMTVGIYINDKSDFNISLNKSYPDGTTWVELLNQTLDALRAYGYIIRDKTLVIDSEGRIEE